MIKKRLMTKQKLTNQRADATQIPTKEELLTILSLESQRRLPPKKLDSNGQLVDYSPLIKLLKCLRINFDPEIFTTVENRWDTAKPLLVEYLNQTIARLAIELNNPTLDLLQNLDAIYDYLTEDDGDIVNQDTFKADLGFVFGAKSTIRAERALDLYNLGRINQIMVSGKSPFYKGSPISEAENLANFLTQNNVPERLIIQERLALTIPDNVKRSMDLMELRKIKFDSIVLITSPFAMRRSYVDWLKFLPVESNIKLYRINSNVSAKFSKSQWFRSDEGLKIILNEYFKMRLEWFIDKYFEGIEHTVTDH